MGYRTRFRSIVLSDLHLGAANSRGEELLRFLDQVDPQHVVLAGDVFDRPHLGHLRDVDLRVLEALRQLAMDRHVEWLGGNHDPSKTFFRAVLGIDAKDETTLDLGDGRRYLVYHGHGWDHALTWPKWIIAGADGVYHTSQRIDPSHRLARFLKVNCKLFTKSVGRLRDRAVAVARRRGMDGVILGHCHMSEDVVIDGIHYLNSGCWTEKPASFIGVDLHGRVRREIWTGLHPRNEPARSGRLSIATPRRVARLTRGIGVGAALAGSLLLSAAGTIASFAGAGSTDTGEPA
jgi:UDP-2,3-diacylglucosamine pyrophosphatase LpxH